MSYNYVKEITEDIKDYIIINNIPLDIEVDELVDEHLWANDEITGNDANYYASEEECKNYIIDNLNLYFEAAVMYDAFPTSGTEKWTEKNPAQTIDCLIRCSLVYECAERAFEELNGDV